jgi:hypothetical protein
MAIQQSNKFSKNREYEKDEVAAQTNLVPESARRMAQAAFSPR